MPKLISFDIGIRNLAYCIFNIESTVSIQDWNVIDISLGPKTSQPEIKTCLCITKKKGKENGPCSKKAKYFLGPSLCFCEKHAKLSEYPLPAKEFEKSQIKKLSVDSLQDFILKWKIPMNLGEKKNLPKGEKIEIITKWIEEYVLHKIDGNSKKKGETLDFIQIGRNMVDHLSKIDLADIEYVVIENQISPIANKMRTIQGMLAQIFILQKVPTIEFVSSSNKLREYLGEKKRKKRGKRQKKKRQKKNPYRIQIINNIKKMAFDIRKNGWKVDLPIGKLSSILFQRNKMI